MHSVARLSADRQTRTVSFHIVVLSILIRTRNKALPVFSPNLSSSPWKAMSLVTRKHVARVHLSRFPRLTIGWPLFTSCSTCCPFKYNIHAIVLEHDYQKSTETNRISKRKRQQFSYLFCIQQRFHFWLCITLLLRISRFGWRFFMTALSKTLYVSSPLFRKDVQIENLQSSQQYRAIPGNLSQNYKFLLRTCLFSRRFVIWSDLAS